MAEETLTKKDIQGLLGEQTKQIEQRLSEQTTQIEQRLAEQTTVILDAVDEKIKNLDVKFTEKLDKLITTLDGFLKRMTDMEEEFAMMRNDINRMKKVIREKLGVELS